MGYVERVLSFDFDQPAPYALPAAWLWLREQLLPKELLPIADNASGDYLCILLGGDDAGSVIYLWKDLLSLPEHDLQQLRSQRGFVKIAGSFAEFLSILR